MKTKAVRLYNKNDLRLEEFDLPEIKDNEILAEVITDSLCMSTLKAVKQGIQHNKVPDDISKNPIIVGHEFCGNILAVGKKWIAAFHPGDKFVIQPNIGAENCYAPGYSYPLIGGDATKIIIQNQVMENGSLLHYNGKTYFEGSLVEPLSCVIGAFNANYHLERMYSHKHVMGIKENGSMAILGATGPMGYLAIDLALHGPKKPKLLVVTGRTQEKLNLVEKLYPKDEAKKQGVELYYINTRDSINFKDTMKKIMGEFIEFNDVFVFAPDEKLVQQAETLLSYDGCLNFFAGPTDHEFSPNINFYNVHYKATHIVGTSGGNTNDMKEAVSLIESQNINAAKIVSHILGLNDAAKATINLSDLGGGKKIVYTNKKFPLTQLSDFHIAHNNFEKTLSQIIKKNNGFWSFEAERYFIEHAPEI
ncbi:zinc-binding dehydrogenase [Pectinatus haikarae]|uniref:Threonine dehydrogenase-like Zn-dependent dehydrogenase n=1 Tax=Pectinatus haikarae TaxID=349096 RepID=A0ABT9YAN0_9FIRM|nr:zinc-binding dehydrogenase [Pectinatus haikarae]MDQ0204791.1 threonine dehydrogenase-like Zn-dependent dehydrogenase [Pectinatus haikarae]